MYKHACMRMDIQVAGADKFVVPSVTGQNAEKAKAQHRLDTPPRDKCMWEAELGSPIVFADDREIALCRACDLIQYQIDGYCIACRRASSTVAAVVTSSPYTSATALGLEQALPHTLFLYMPIQ